MKPLCLSLREPPSQRLDMRGLTPEALQGLTALDIAKRPLNGQQLGEFFDVSGHPGEHLIIDQACEYLHAVGAHMSCGSITVQGCVGAYLGCLMTGGRIEVHGDCGPFAGCGMVAGEIHVNGSAGDYLGSAASGERAGMRGGQIVVRGHAGDRVGDRQRRGVILIQGNAGAYCASRMIAGSIAVLGRVGENPGYAMRRGTLLLAQQPAALVPTFNANGRQELPFLTLLHTQLQTLARSCNTLAHPPQVVQRWVGDRVCNGLGEILIWENP